MAQVKPSMDQVFENALRGLGVLVLAFSLDGNQLVASYGDRSIIAWDARPLYDPSWVSHNMASRPKRSLEPPKRDPLTLPYANYDPMSFVGNWHSSRAGTIVRMGVDFTWSSGGDSGRWSIKDNRIVWSYNSHGGHAIESNPIFETGPNRFVLLENDWSQTTFTRENPKP